MNVSNQRITLQKTLLNKKCEERDSDINAYASLLFNQEWKSFPQYFTFGSPTKSKGVQTSVSIKSEVLQWFKGLSIEQKSDIFTIKDKFFILNFLKNCQNDHSNRQINFSSGYSVASLFPNEQHILKFKQIKSKICVALTQEPILYINLAEGFSSQKILDWFQEITNNKIFEYANKTINKQQPEQNILWFNSSSFHSLDKWLINQIQKSVVKCYFKRDTLPSYKLKQLKKHMQSKYPNEAKLLSLSIEEANRFSKEEIQNLCSVIKGYENSYYEDIRQNFIQSLEILQNQKDIRKKKKNKRKGKKKASFSPTQKVLSPQQKDLISLFRQ